MSAGDFYKLSCYFGFSFFVEKEVVFLFVFFSFSQRNSCSGKARAGDVSQSRSEEENIWHYV